MMIRVYSKFPLTSRAINVCAAPKILKFLVLVLEEIEVGHPWSTVYNLKKKKLKRRVTDTRLNAGKYQMKAGLLLYKTEVKSQ